jgi:hypothetical protein
MSSLPAFAASAVFGSATRASIELVKWDAALRTVVLHCRHLAFVHLGDERDASTTAGYVATLLAARRAGRVLAVDASGGTAPARPDDLSSRAVDILPALDLSAPGRRVSVPDWSARVTPVVRFFDVAVTDWGRRHYRDLPLVAAASHALCLVMAAEGAAAQPATDIVSWLRTSVPATRVLIALAGRQAPRRTALHTLRRTVPAVMARTGHHRDHVRLAATLMDAAQGRTADQGNP